MCKKCVKLGNELNQAIEDVRSWKFLHDTEMFLRDAADQDKKFWQERCEGGDVDFWKKDAKFWHEQYLQA